MVTTASSFSSSLCFHSLSSFVSVFR
jgi:hypothetical protein